VEQQDKLVEQQGQIITLLSAITQNPVSITAKAPACPTTVTTALSTPFSTTAAVSQIPPVPVPSRKQASSR